MAAEVPGDDRARDAFVRWQSRTADQLGFVSNLILGLSTAAIGFLASALLDGKVPTSGGARWVFLVALFCELVATVGGVGLACNRLVDFRRTMETTRARLNGETDHLLGLRDESRALGEATWRLLTLQAWSFLAGVVATTAYVVMQS